MWKKASHFLPDNNNKNNNNDNDINVCIDLTDE